MSNLLAGVRVVESAMLFNGDTVGAHLGDLGADVIKVEGPPVGDYIRYFLGQIQPGFSPAHVQINRNKRSIAIDLRMESGKDIFWRLLGTSDVFIDGNSSDACDRLGIGFEAQRLRKRDIIYCQYSGFGATGPYAAIPTHGQMMDALAGACPVEMGSDGLMHPGQHVGPIRGVNSGGEGTAAGAIHAAFHIAAALVQRANTGEGAHIDVSGTEGVLAQAWIAVTYALNEGRITDWTSMPVEVDGKMGAARYQFYQCADDKNLLFCCIEPKFWNQFCRALERDDLLAIDGPPAAEYPGPVDLRDDELLRHELQRIFSTRTIADWMAFAVAHDIPMGPAPRSVVEAAHDPHLSARGAFHTDTHPQVGEFTFVKPAGNVDGQPYRIRRHAPEFGANTRELLQELGYSEIEIADLAAQGAVSLPQ